MWIKIKIIETLEDEGKWSNEKERKKLIKRKKKKIGA